MNTATATTIEITDLSDAELDALLARAAGERKDRDRTVRLARRATYNRARRARAAAADAAQAAPKYTERLFCDTTYRWILQERPLVVGMGASFGYGCDSYAYTVVSVSRTGHEVGIVSASQDRKTGEWSHDADCPPQIFTRRKPGRDGESRYCCKGDSARSPSLSLDCRIERLDPHF